MDKSSLLVKLCGDRVLVERQICRRHVNQLLYASWLTKEPEFVAFGLHCTRTQHDALGSAWQITEAWRRNCCEQYWTRPGSCCNHSDRCRKRWEIDRFKTTDSIKWDHPCERHESGESGWEWQCEGCSGTSLPERAIKELPPPKMWPKTLMFYVFVCGTTIKCCPTPRCKVLFIGSIFFFVDMSFSVHPIYCVHRS